MERDVIEIVEIIKSCTAKKYLLRKLVGQWILLYNSRMSRQKQVEVEITHYVLCSDDNCDTHGWQGPYKIVSRVCWKVDSDVYQEKIVGNEKIPFDSIFDLETLKLKSPNAEQIRSTLGDFSFISISAKMSFA